MRTFRRIVFWIFVGLYFTICPLTVLYALGYWFQPGSVGGLVKTGLISLATEPSGASVYLGNRRYTQKTPTVLRDLLPGDYPVKLVLKDRQPWTRTVSVEAEKATVLERVLLLPRALAPRTLLAGPFERLIPVHRTPLLLLTAGPRASEIMAYDVQDEVSWPLLPADSPLRTARVPSMTMVPESKHVLLRFHTPAGEQMEWVELAAVDARVEPLASLFPTPPVLAAWDSSETRWLFAMVDRALHRLDRKEKAIYPRIAEHVLGFGLFEKTLYVLEDDGTVARLTLEGKRLEAREDDLGIARHTLEIKPPVQLTILSPQVVLALGERGELLANQFPYRLANKGILGIEP
ncbi:MAG: PEGA domain-containing protein, partial [Candidatus Omnitrophota bacterium]|nr:PEGA domain-containing protein [Candidatus Omnitrophota bacterium]